MKYTCVKKKCGYSTNNIYDMIRHCINKKHGWVKDEGKNIKL